MTFARATRKTKESGIKWVGAIPRHWRVIPFHLFVDEVSHLNKGLTERNLLSLSYGRIVRKDMERVEGLTPASFEGYNIINANDIVFRLTDLQNDQISLRSARSPERGIITSAYITVRPRSSPRFFDYLMRSYDTTKVFYGIGGGIRQSMNFAELKRLPVLVPPVEEMETIATYLDRATARIERLIAKKTRFIELLKEKRQALIAHVVTKGLDTTAPMKDSGIAWLGAIPQHWLVCPSKRLFSVRSEPARPDDRVLTASQKHGVIYQSDFVETEGRRVVEVILGIENLKHVEPDDFIISMRSFQGGLEWCQLRGSTSFHYVMVTPISNVWPPFFARLFKSAPYIHALRRTSDLIRDGQELRYSNFIEVPLPVVPLEEQKRIAIFLDIAIARIDALIAKTERSIDLLREHRTALITAAVTGKIDLRHAP